MFRLLRAVPVILLAFGRLTATSAQEEGGPRPIEGVEVIRPEGEFAQVVLEFNVPGAPGAFPGWVYHGSLRGGQIRTDHGMGIRNPGGELDLKNGRLTGTFTRALGRRRDMVVAEVTVDAAVRDGVIEGKAVIAGQEGTVSGRVIPEAELARRNAVSPERGWPSFLGPAGGGTSGQPAGVALVDSADEFRVVWRSEETDIGQGVGSISRFMNGWQDANGMRTASGSSSPVAGDGKIFLSYYVPSPTPRDVPRGWFEGVGHSSFEADRARLAEQSGLAADALPTHALEKIWSSADDVVLAMDAATGRTVWKAVMRDRGLSLQHHKVGPFNMTPAYGEGRVFAIGMSGWLYAFDASSGEPLWEVRLGLGRGAMFSSTAVAVRGAVVAPSQGVWAGFDPATGRELWRSDLRHGQVSLAVWPQGGTDYLLGSAGSAMVCLHPATGETVWRLDLPNQPERAVAVRSAGRGLGSGGISVFGDTLLAYVDETDPAAQSNAERAASLKPHLAAWRLGGGEPILAWTVPVETLHGGNVPVVVRDRYVFAADLQVIRLADGQVVARGEGSKPGNGGYLQAMEDLVFVRRDGTHGRIESAVYRVAENGSVTNLTPEGHWAPPIGGGTTSYHHPIMYPMVEGRMFLRQFDGVYAWDLRKP